MGKRGVELILLFGVLFFAVFSAGGVEAIVYANQSDGFSVSEARNQRRIFN
ncbi:MAG: hypothetical protein AABY03_00535 [Nanoarchaeota archaeon]